MSYNNVEELYFAIKALQNEFCESVEILYDMFDLHQYYTAFQGCDSPEELNRKIRKTLRRYIKYDYFSFKTLDIRSGIFYELKGNPLQS